MKTNFEIDYSHRLLAKGISDEIGEIKELGATIYLGDGNYIRLSNEFLLASKEIANFGKDSDLA